jgi:hypothetical protein
VTTSFTAYSGAVADPENKDLEKLVGVCNEAKARDGFGPLGVYLAQDPEDPEKCWVGLVLEDSPALYHIVVKREYLTPASLFGPAEEYMRLTDFINGDEILKTSLGIVTNMLGRAGFSLDNQRTKEWIEEDIRKVRHYYQAKFLERQLHAGIKNIVGLDEESWENFKADVDARDHAERVANEGNNE